MIDIRQLYPNNPDKQRTLEVKGTYSLNDSSLLEILSRLNKNNINFYLRTYGIEICGDYERANGVQTHTAIGMLHSGELMEKIPPGLYLTTFYLRRRYGVKSTQDLISLLKDFIV